jgi:hypothetical protein
MIIIRSEERLKIFETCEGDCLDLEVPVQSYLFMSPKIIPPHDMLNVVGSHVKGK